MAEPDRPTFLTTAPIVPPEPAARPALAPPPTHGPYRTPEPPRPVQPPWRVSRPAEPDPPAPEPEADPGALARYLGPGRMPRLMIRFPRIIGLAFVALGVLGWREVQELAARLADPASGYVVYSRGAPFMMAIGFGLGGFLLAFGRPADAHGYSPAWWNKTYVAVCVASLFAAFAIRAA